MKNTKTQSTVPSDATQDEKKNIPSDSAKKTEQPAEIGGPKGLEPTRFGDWERGGRCSDF
jgi:hypothetical protein